MPGTYTRAQRAELEKALKAKAPLVCPECGTAMTEQPVVAPSNVPYVRHRMWLMCMKCRRSAAVNI